MKTSNTRKNFLQSGGSLLALPFLESFGKNTTLPKNKKVSEPKRLVFISMGWGVTEETWYPNQDDEGYQYTLPQNLQPLKKYKSEFTLVQNLYHKFTQDGHSGSTFWLTGANRFGIPGKSFHNTISVDQVAAEQFGQNTRYSSIRLSSLSRAGHGTGALSWNKTGKPMSSLNSPLKLYHKLFSEENVSLSEREHMLNKQKSILDTVFADAKSLQHKLCSNDRDKIDEYFQSIRDIETRLAKEKQWLSIPKAQLKHPVPAPDSNLKGYEEIKIIYDLIVLAMQVDASRVFTYKCPTDSLLRSLGETITSHDMSHYGEAKRHISEKRDLAHAKLLAHFIGRLKSISHIDGSTLFDHTTLTFGSNIRSYHHLTNCPTLIMGGGSGINHGRNIVMNDPKTPLCNLWLSLLRSNGIKVKSFGDSRGTIDELFV